MNEITYLKVVIEKQDKIIKIQKETIEVMQKGMDEATDIMNEIAENKDLLTKE